MKNKQSQHRSEFDTRASLPSYLLRLFSNTTILSLRSLQSLPNVAKLAKVPKVSSEIRLFFTLLGVPGQTDVGAELLSTEHTRGLPRRRGEQLAFPAYHTGMPPHRLPLPAEVPESQNHNEDKGLPESLEVMCSNPPAQAGAPRAGCPRPCPDAFGIPNSETYFYKQQPDKLNCKNICNTRNRLRVLVTLSYQVKYSLHHTSQTIPHQQRLVTISSLKLYPTAC